jgi:PhoH-like ATPase
VYPLKNFIIDTNVLLDNENCIEILSNGGENKIFIPATVLEELDGLKKNAQKRHQVFRAIQALKDNIEHIVILSNGVKHESGDNSILKEITSNEDKATDPILVTNDALLQFKAAAKFGMAVEPFKDSNPFKSESQRYTGFVNIGEGEALERNCFYWHEGKLHFNGPDGKAKLIDYENEIWKVKPRTPYQNAALDLMLNGSVCH